MKIIGSELQQKLDIFNSSHRVDPECEYYYGSIEDKIPVEEKKKYLVANNLGHCRSVVIDEIHHFWKPAGEEKLIRKIYSNEKKEEK